jgi:molybdopterin converting factor small subunit
MAVSIRIPASLRTLTQGKEEVTVSGATVRDVLADLDAKFPGFKDRLLDDKGVKRFMNVYLGDEDIRFLDGLDSAVKDGESLTIVPAIAGGARGARGRRTRFRTRTARWTTSVSVDRSPCPSSGPRVRPGSPPSRCASSATRPRSRTQHNAGKTQAE